MGEQDRRRHLRESDMYKAVGMLEAGVRQIVVAEQMGTSQSVISRLWRRYRDTGTPKEQHPGRGRATTAIQDRYITLQARRQNSITATELQSRLQATHNVLVHGQTIRRRLREANLHCRRPLRVPPRTVGNRGHRVTWAQEHSGWTQEQWSTVLFTDESRFGFRPDTRRLRVWRPPGNVARLQHAQDVHSYRGGTIMVWAGIMLGRKTDLVFLNQFLNAERYIQTVLEPILEPFVEAFGHNITLMHDNARPHTARVVTDWLHVAGIDVLPWPAQSPDLNPIEHAWDMLQRRCLPHMEAVQNRRQHQELLSEQWNLLPQADIDTLILSMPRRCRAVLNARGGPTLY